MSSENPEIWPLPPSQAASVLSGLCVALADLIREEGGGEVSERSYLKMYSLAVMAEVLAGEGLRQLQQEVVTSDE